MCSPGRRTSDVRASASPRASISTSSMGRLLPDSSVEGNRNHNQPPTAPLSPPVTWRDGELAAVLANGPSGEHEPLLADRALRRTSRLITRRPRPVLRRLTGFAECYREETQFPK